MHHRVTLTFAEHHFWRLLHVVEAGDEVEILRENQTSLRLRPSGDDRRRRFYGWRVVARRRLAEALHQDRRT